MNNKNDYFACFGRISDWADYVERYDLSIIFSRGTADVLLAINPKTKDAYGEFILDDKVEIAFDSSPMHCGGIVFDTPDGYVRYSNRSNCVDK